MIQFTTGSISVANAAAVGQAMAEKIRDDVVLHAAWELVEEYTPGGSQITWYVFRCLASESGLPADFYVVIGRTISTGQLNAFVCEGYNAGTHTCTYFASGHPSSGTTAYDASGRNAGTITLGTTALPTSNILNAPSHTRWTPSGTSTNWWLTVDDDGFTVAFNGASNGWMHFGAYEWLAETPNAMPVHFMGATSGLIGTGITRNPAVMNNAAAPTGALFPDGSPGNGTGAPTSTLGFVGRLDVNDLLNDGKRLVSELGLFLANTTPGTAFDASAIGWAIGKVKRMRYGSNPPAGVSFGDTYALNDTLWVPYLGSNGRIWDTGVAA